MSVFSKKAKDKVKADSKSGSALQRFLDPRKESFSRIKYLKTLFESYTSDEERQLLLDEHHSTTFQVFHDLFLQAEYGLRNRSSKNGVGELELALWMLENCLYYLPHLLVKGWQFNCLVSVFKKLLHPHNTAGLRKFGLRYFIVWYQILGVGDFDLRHELDSIFAALVPDHDGKLGTLERICSCPDIGDARGAQSDVDTGPIHPFTPQAIYYGQAVTALQHNQQIYIPSAATGHPYPSPSGLSHDSGGTTHGHVGGGSLSSTSSREHIASHSAQQHHLHSAGAHPQQSPLAYGHRSPGSVYQNPAATGGNIMALSSETEKILSSLIDKILEIVVRETTNVRWKTGSADGLTHQHHRCFAFLFERVKQLYFPYYWPCMRNVDIYREGKAHHDSASVPSGQRRHEDEASSSSAGKVTSSGSVRGGQDKTASSTSSMLTVDTDLPTAIGSKTFAYSPVWPVHDASNCDKVLYPGIAIGRNCVIRWMVMYVAGHRRSHHHHNQHSHMSSNLSGDSTLTRDPQTHNQHGHQHSSSSFESATPGSGGDTLTYHSTAEAGGGRVSHRAGGGATSGGADKLPPNFEMVRFILFGSRDNISLTLSILHEAMFLPTKYNGTISRVIRIWREWIVLEDIPVFLTEPDNKSPNPDLDLRAGLQLSLQAVIQMSSSLFFTDHFIPFHQYHPPQQRTTSRQQHSLSPKSVEELSDLAKRVLSLYRLMVTHVEMTRETWLCLLTYLQRVAESCLGDGPSSDNQLATRLASSIFQTLLVTWVRANLNVQVGVELWDQLQRSLLHLTNWPQLADEWSKIMESLTRALSYQVYGIDLHNPPLERLSEQKAMKQRSRSMIADTSTVASSRPSPSMHPSTSAGNQHHQSGSREHLHHQTNAQHQQQHPHGSQNAQQAQNVQFSRGWSVKGEPLRTVKPILAHQHTLPDTDEESHLAGAEDAGLTSDGSVSSHDRKSSRCSNYSNDGGYVSGKTGLRARSVSDNQGLMTPVGNDTSSSDHGSMELSSEELDRAGSLEGNEQNFNPETSSLDKTPSIFDRDSLTPSPVHGQPGRPSGSDGNGSIGRPSNYLGDEDFSSAPEDVISLVGGGRRRGGGTDSLDSNSLGGTTTASGTDPKVSVTNSHVGSRQQRQSFSGTTPVPPPGGGKQAVPGRLLDVSCTGPGAHSAALKESLVASAFRELRDNRSKLNDIGDPNANANASVLSGGPCQGWLPDVAVVLWRRVLGILGDVNQIKQPHVHTLIMEHLSHIEDLLLKTHANQGVLGAGGAVTTQDGVDGVPDPLGGLSFIPPIDYTLPWFFDAVLTLPYPEYAPGQRMALSSMCKVILRRRPSGPPDEPTLLSFYSCLHRALNQCNGKQPKQHDLEMLTVIINACSPRLFTLGLPGASLLILDVLTGCRRVLDSPDVGRADKLKAARLVSSLAGYIDGVREGCAVLQSSSGPGKGATGKQTSTDEVVVAAKPDSLLTLILHELVYATSQQFSDAVRSVALKGLGLLLYRLLSPSWAHEKDPTAPSGEDQYAGLWSMALNSILYQFQASDSTVSMTICEVLAPLSESMHHLINLHPSIPCKIIELFCTVLSDSLARVRTVAVSFRVDLRVDLCTAILQALCEWTTRLPMDFLLRQIDSRRSYLVYILETISQCLLDDDGYYVDETSSRSPDKRDGGEGGQSGKGQDQDAVSIGSDTNLTPRAGAGGHHHHHSRTGDAIHMAAVFALSHLSSHVGQWPLAALGIGTPPSEFLASAHAYSIVENQLRADQQQERKSSNPAMQLQQSSTANVQHQHQLLSTCAQKVPIVMFGAQRPYKDVMLSFDATSCFLQSPGVLCSWASGKHDVPNNKNNNLASPGITLGPGAFKMLCCDPTDVTGLHNQSTKDPGHTCNGTISSGGSHGPKTQQHLQMLKGSRPESKGSVVPSPNRQQQLSCGYKHCAVLSRTPAGGKLNWDVWRQMPSAPEISEWHFPNIELYCCIQPSSSFAGGKSAVPAHRGSYTAVACSPDGRFDAAVQRTVNTASQHLQPALDVSVSFADAEPQLAAAIRHHTSSAGTSSNNSASFSTSSFDGGTPGGRRKSGTSGWTGYGDVISYGWNPLSATTGSAFKRWDSTCSSSGGAGSGGSGSELSGSEDSVRGAGVQNAFGFDLSAYSEGDLYSLPRLLMYHLGVLSLSARNRVGLFPKSERLMRELRHIDGQSATREQHKFAVVFVGEGQQDKQSILSNSSGSPTFESFVSGLGWDVDLGTHKGYMGGLPILAGTSSVYYASPTVEIMYHVSTKLPGDDLNKKVRHLGNDEIHIVWSEHWRDYHRGTIATDFCDIMIVIYPLPNHLFRIEVNKKPDVEVEFGPLFDGALVDWSSLASLVRTSAIHASRARRRSTATGMSYRPPFYETRLTDFDRAARELHQPTMAYRQVLQHALGAFPNPNTLAAVAGDSSAASGTTSISGAASSGSIRSAGSGSVKSDPNTGGGHARDWETYDV